MAIDVKLTINNKELTYSHKNVFDGGEIHYLFSDGMFLYWVNVLNDVVIGICGTLKEEADSWEWWDEPFTDKQFQEHEKFADFLDHPEHYEKFQNILIKL
jgi:hypothetical protein